MSYVRKVITTQEKLLSISRPHWIYLLKGLIWFLFFAVFGFALDYYFFFYTDMYEAPLIRDLWVSFLGIKITLMFFLFLGVGLATMWSYILIFISSEVGLTDQRIIYKRGLMFIEIDQVDLDDIRAEHVRHGWFGWLLGYGKIHLDCRFIEDVELPAITDPYRLVKASHNARMKHPLIDYGHEELQANLERIEAQQEHSRHVKRHMQQLKITFKNRFQKAA